ncbi:MAG: DMT family transporter [Patescibacteria group bacterium]
MDKRLKKAILLALGTAAISGTAVFLGKIAVTVVPNPTAFTFLKNALVAVLLVGALLIATRLKELKSLKKNDWWKLIAIGVIGGSLPFSLFFTGLTMTTAGSAALIHKSLFIWVALLAVPFLREKIGWIQGGALALLLLGNILMIGWRNFSFGAGELMILAATVFWAVENIIAKKALKNLSSVLVASARMVFGSVILLVVVGWQGNLGLLTGLSPIQWMWTIIPSILLLGYVLTWYTALKHAPATLVASLLVPASLITNFLSLIFLDKSIAVYEAIGSIFLVTAVSMIIWQAKKIYRQKEYARE